MAVIELGSVPSTCSSAISNIRIGLPNASFPIEHSLNRPRVACFAVDRPILIGNPIRIKWSVASYLAGDCYQAYVYIVGRYFFCQGVSQTAKSRLSGRERGNSRAIFGIQREATSR